MVVTAWEQRTLEDAKGYTVPKYTVQQSLGHSAE